MPINGSLLTGTKEQILEIVSEGVSIVSRVKRVSVVQALLCEAGSVSSCVLRSLVSENEAPGHALTPEALQLGGKTSPFQQCSTAAIKTSPSSVESQS